jgi:hypothetical protein
VPTPAVVELDVIASLIDATPVAITTTLGWQKVPEVVSRYALMNHRPVWRRMHFDDWDRVPAAIREDAMAAMIHTYTNVLTGPQQWTRMSTYDWDAVPQPVRAIAYLRMIWYWAEEERVGASFGWRARDLAPTIGAIVMAESWFEHRAVNENAWGRDLGLAQCSDHCRRTLRTLAAAGKVPFLLEDDQYFNPWFATRVAVVWFEHELVRAGGDVDMAIRAYHRGIDNAWDAKGDAYHAGVVDKRTRYILNQGAPHSWRFLVGRVLAAGRPSLTTDGPVR